MLKHKYDKYLFKEKEFTVLRFCSKLQKLQRDYLR